MNENYKKLADKFSEDGELEFYTKIEKMKKGLEYITNLKTKQNIENNISTMIQSYDNMKKYYFECVESEKKIKDSQNLNKKLGRTLFEKKMDYIKNEGHMFRDDSDQKFGLSKN